MVVVVSEDRNLVELSGQFAVDTVEVVGGGKKQCSVSESAMEYTIRRIDTTYYATRRHRIW